jgi:hypothetical protein
MIVHVNYYQVTFVRSRESFIRKIRNLESLKGHEIRLLESRHTDPLKLDKKLTFPSSPFFPLHLSLFRRLAHLQALPSPDTHYHQATTPTTHV